MCTGTEAFEQRLRILISSLDLFNRLADRDRTSLIRSRHGYLRNRGDLGNFLYGTNFLSISGSSGISLRFI